MTETPPINPLYNRGTVPLNGADAYLYFVEGTDEPVAAFVSGWGESSVWVDLERGFAGSPLLDLTIPMPLEEAMEWLPTMFMENPGTVINVKVKTRLITSNVTGLSVDDIQKSALAWLVEWNLDHEDDKQNLINLALEQIRVRYNPLDM